MKAKCAFVLIMFLGIGGGLASADISDGSTLDTMRREWREALNVYLSPGSTENDETRVYDRFSVGVAHSPEAAEVAFEDISVQYVRYEKGAEGRFKKIVPLLLGTLVQTYPVVPFEEAHTNADHYVLGRRVVHWILDHAGHAIANGSEDRAAFALRLLSDRRVAEWGLVTPEDVYLLIRSSENKVFSGTEQGEKLWDELRQVVEDTWRVHRREVKLGSWFVEARKVDLEKSLRSFAENKSAAEWEARRWSVRGARGR